MDGWLLAVVIVLGLTAFVALILLCLAGFLALLYSIFARTSGWSALAQKYGAASEPEGRKLVRQTLKLGPVRWRLCMTVILSQRGLYLAAQSRIPVPSPWGRRYHPPLLIPWSEFKSPRQGRLYLGWQAVEMSIGEPQMAVITFPQGLYNEMAGYIPASVGDRKAAGGPR